MRRIPRAIEATLVNELRLDVLLGRVVDEVGEVLGLLWLAIIAKKLVHGCLEPDAGAIRVVLRRVHALFVEGAAVAVYLMEDACVHRVVCRHTEVHVRVQLLRRYFTEVTILFLLVFVEFLKLREFTSHVLRPLVADLISEVLPSAEHLHVLFGLTLHAPVHGRSGTDLRGLLVLIVA